MENQEQQLSSEILDIINTATQKYRTGETIEQKYRIPLTDSIPFNVWWKIDDVVCVYIDMKNSTQLSANKQDRFTAGIYQYFTDTAVRILNHFGASYIDVRGDGAFGLFDSNKLYHAFASAVSFKTFCVFNIGDEVALPQGLSKIACHIGIDKKTVLVKKIGMKVNDSKTDKSNEVWAGKPVNMASKLASQGGSNDIIVSKRVFEKFVIDKSPLVLKTCGCPNNQKVHVWEELDLQQNPNFDFDKAYKLTPNGWCFQHGKDYCERILNLDA